MVWPQVVVLVLFCILQNLGPVIPMLYRDTYFLKEIEVIPRNEREYMMLTKDLNCEGNALNVAYVLHSTEIKTIMVCTPDKNLSGKWCPEFNPDKLHSLNGIVQSKYNAECENLPITPCKGIYSVWESYLFFECFQIFGGISSPMERVQKLKLCEKRYENTFNEILYVVVIFGIVCVIFCLFLYNFLLLYFIKRFYYKENITYKNYIVSRKILLINFFKSTYSVSDVIRGAVNNTSHSETASELEVIIMDKGKEKKEEQDVNINVREANNQHPHPDENELRGLTVDLDVN